MSSAPSSLHSTPSNTEPPTNDPIQPTRHSWVWVYFSNIDDKYVQCQYVNQFGKTCNKQLKCNHTGSTKGMSQHLHLLHHVANPKSVSSPLAKCHTLDHNDINVSFTADAWKSPNITAYLAVTAHYIDTDFELISIIIGLTEIEGNHSGVSLAMQFMNVLHQYNLDQKIVCITTNNASVNNWMAQEIKAICSRFFSKANAVGFMAHMIHLAAHDGLKALGTSSGDSISSTDEDNCNPMSISSLVDPPDGLHLQYNSIISKISLLASYVCHSTQQQDKFITTVNLVYENNNPGNANTLLSQVLTQWNSAYEMLNQALQLKDAYDHFCTPEALACYWLSPLEWQKAKVMTQFLEPLYKATLLICGSTYPMINQESPLYILLIKSVRQISEQYDVAPIEPAAQEMV
ncbi:hypothetical protein O181_004010 [Austropuccinia psidii MF-1]|uniref:BED-type domain-containing protein n=1 Tax=Austropuccinia psidii MF-1 TaxID=1389203 RepID=A0A9Q3BG48_9BASI|nr:hypothetical protein [Austropuccinia psidii MF-1]